MTRHFVLVVVALNLASCASAAASQATAAEPATSAGQSVGLPADHPYAHALQSFVQPSVCELWGEGWSGDGEIVIKDGRVVSFEAGQTFLDRADPQQSVWNGKQAPDLVGKAVPPIPKDLEPLFTHSVGFDVGCM